MTAMKSISKAKRVGLALGSGSARGWAHIGVIDAIRELGIPVHMVAGTSIGALVGAFFVAGRIDSLRKISHELDWKQMLHFLDVVLPKSGLIDGVRVREFIAEHVGLINIEDLEVPLRCIATDLVTGREVVIGSGDVIEAVRSSISLPGMFTPVRREGMLLVDGGLVNPVPVSVLREMGADLVIAVDLNHDIREKRRPISLSPETEEGNGNHMTLDSLWSLLNREITEIDFSLPAQFEKWFAPDNTPSIFEVMMKSLDILEAQVAETRLMLHPPDILIRPGLGDIRLVEFNRAGEAIDAGYREAMKMLRPG